MLWKNFSLYFKKQITYNGENVNIGKEFVSYGRKKQADGRPLLSH